MRIRPIAYVIAGFIALRLAFSWLTYHLIGWDEAVYLGMGRFLHTFGEQGIWEIIRPLGLPALLALLPQWKYFLMAELLMLIFSSGCIYLAYKIAAQYTNEKAALFAAALLALTPLFFYHSQLIYTDIPASLFVLLALFLLTKDRLLWSGCAAGLAFLFRFPAGLVLVALIICSPRGGWKGTIQRASIILAAFILTVFPYLVINHVYTYTAHYPIVEAMKHQDNAFFEISGLANNVLYYPFILIWQNPAMVFILAAFAFFHRRLFPIYAMFLLFLIYFMQIANKQPRFMLLFLPLAAVLAAYGLARVQHRFRHREVQLLLGAFLVFSLIVQGYAINKLYKAQPKEEPEIVSEYYGFRYEGVVFTTDPVPSIYSDADFITGYAYVSDTYDKYQMTDWDYFIWYPAVMPCYDKECEVTRQKLIESVSQKGELVLNKSYFYEERRVYKRVK
jgi:hypothetical protein